VKSQDNLRAYRLLIHAEIEFYLENTVKKKVTKSIDNWKNHKKINKTLTSLLAFSTRNFQNIPGVFHEIPGRNDLNFRIQSVVRDFYLILKKNNGIKENNIVNLLIPIGIEADQINQILISNLNSFGALRGEQAHSSFKIQRLIVPQDEIGMVDSIINDLKELEELVKQC
jgi:hypothetical protein